MMGSFVRVHRRLWIDTYNWPRKFDNGIVWVRVSVRLRGWHSLGGLWMSKHRPFVRLMSPGAGPKDPIGG